MPMPIPALSLIHISAKQFEKVANIVRQDARRKYVVPSAPGKAFDSDIKVTDLFYQYYEQAQDCLLYTSRCV